jgi:phage terminase large subunit-like protein
LEKDWQYYFDRDDAEWYLGIFEHMRLWEGSAAGEVFELDGWKQFIVWCLYGWKRKKDDKRRFRTSYVEVARKNAKSTFAGGIEIIGFGFDGEKGAQVYSAATKAQQAKICFDIAKNIIEASPLLRNRWKMLQYNISDLKTASKMEYLGANAKKSDGLNPSTVVIDEFHAHPNSDLFDVLDSATGAREQPLMFIITTAGFNKNGVCFQKRKYTIDILDPNSDIEDDTWFGIIFTLDKDDDWHDESVWIKSNPSLGVTVRIDDLRRKASRAKAIPSELNNFLTKHMNVWTDAQEAFIPSDKWAKCCAYDVTEEVIQGRTAYFGLDLASVSDFCALTVLLEPNDRYPKWDVLTRYYIPEDGVNNRKNADIVVNWINQGYISTTPGNATDYAFIEHDIRRFLEMVSIAPDGFGFDPYKSQDIVQRLMADGVQCVPVRQGYITISPNIDELERMILAQEINFGNDPVLKWMNSNTVITKDPAGNRKIDKGKSQDKIDGIASLLNAIDRSKAVNDDDEFIYNQNPVIFSA